MLENIPYKDHSIFIEPIRRQAAFPSPRWETVYLTYIDQHVFGRKLAASFHSKGAALRAGKNWIDRNC